MMLDTPSPPVVPPPRSGSIRPARTLLAFTGLLLCLGIGLPLFLAMPLWVDPITFDILARQVLRGDVLYRDIFAHGLPGMIW